MRICFIADGESPHTIRWVDWFAKIGHEVHLITDRSADIENARQHLLRKRGGILSFIIRTLQVRKIVRKIDPNILHAHYIFGYGIFGALSGFHPFVVSMWGTEIFPEVEPKLRHTFVRKSIAKLLINYVLKKTDLIQTLDNYQKDLCIKAGVPKDKIVVLYNYVDTSVFSPDKRSQELRRELGIDNSIAVICLRGFHPYYNIKTFIEAIPHVVKVEKNVRFILAGKQGTENDKSEIFNLTKKLGITDYINFVGHISLENLPTYLASCDLHVDPMMYGAGIGHGNMQAMSCGLSRIAAERKGLEETVKDGETGYVFRGRNSRDLADKIILLIRNENLRRVFGARCREFVETVNRSGQNEIGIEKYYRKLIAKYKK